MLYSGGSFSFLPVMRYLCLSAGSDDCTIFPTNRFLQVSAYILGPPHSVLPCHLLQWPRNTSKLCQGSAVLVTKMDWAVNLPHRSPQTHSLCHWYPAAEIASFPPFPHEHWQVKGLDKSYISLSLQISHCEGVLSCLSLPRSFLALFSTSAKSIVRRAGLHQGSRHILQINAVYLGHVTQFGRTSE